MGERPRLVAVAGVNVEDGRNSPAALGKLTITGDITGLSRARLFGAKGRQTRAHLRFPAMAYAGRELRGFEVEFHTEDGAWDLRGSNSPVCFLRNPGNITSKRNPAAMWDFWSRAPESLHQLTILFSDRGIPATLRHMHGFGGHGFSLINAKGQRVWCRFHFRSVQGIRNLTDAENAIIGPNRYNHRRDLFEAIRRGEFPRWKMMIQIMGEEEARECPFDPFDATRIWPHRRWPLIEVGVLELHENPVEDHAPVASSPAHLVPGIGHGPDRTLQSGIGGDDDHTQPGDLFRLMGDGQRAALMDAIARSMADVPEAIQRRQIGHFAKADPAYGAGVTKRLGLGPALSIAAE